MGKHTFIAPYGTFKCKNNDEILISIQNNREFEKFCKNILKKESLHKNLKFKNNPERYKNRVELDEIITKCFSKYSKDEIQKSWTEKVLLMLFLTILQICLITNFSKMKMLL